MSGGWIPAWRKLFDREDWMRPTKRNPASYVHAWLDLCQMAQHKDGHEQGEVRLAQGEVLVANRTLAKRWGWSKSAVSRFIERAKRGTMIGTVRGTPQGTVYRIVKYEDYAIPEKHSRDTSRDDSRDTSGTPAGQEQQLTINKQQTDLVDGSTDSDPFPAKPRMRNGNRVYPDPFERAWAAYPKRDGPNPKTGAYKAFRARVMDGYPVDNLVKAAEHYRKHCESREQDGTRFVQQASTFYGPQEPWAEFVEPADTNGNGTKDLRPVRFY